jgi:hypothetical protein
MSRINRILIAIPALFATGLIVSLINFRDISTALANSLLFALLTGALLLWLHLGATMAERKGYGTWLGTVLVLFLNLLGFVILWLLPDRQSATVGKR